MVNSLPPAPRKVSFPRMAISSRVSRQSETKAGHMTRSFFTPSFASLGSSKSVYGLAKGHGRGAIGTRSRYFVTPALFTKARVVLKH